MRVFIGSERETEIRRKKKRVDTYPQLSRNGTLALCKKANRA